jgi:hypothetical protein
MNPISTAKTRLIEAIRETSPDLHRLGLMEECGKQGIPVDDCIEHAPIKDAAQLRGFLRGIDTTVARDADRDLGS